MKKQREDAQIAKEALERLRKKTAAAIEVIRRMTSRVPDTVQQGSVQTAIAYKKAAHAGLAAIKAVNVDRATTAVCNKIIACAAELQALEK